MRVKVKIKSLLFFILISVILTLVKCDENSLAHDLRHAIRGQIFIRGTPAYEAHRSVQNGACRHIYPALIVRPENTEEVSKVVKIANKHKKQISVRSGGHSYQCQGLIQDSLNVDLRSLRTVKVISPHEAILGAGNTWGQVLDVIDNRKFTYIHGQCLNVGVSGFLLGLGTNLIGTSSRFGAGADHVLQHTVVLGDGSIAVVNKENTTVFDDAYNSQGHVIHHEHDNDLRYALRTSGSSFGITTEFRYKIYKRAETMPLLVPIFLENSYDFRNLERATADGRFGLYVADTYYFVKTAATHFVSVILNRPN